MLVGRSSDEVMAKLAERIKTHLHNVNHPKNVDVAADAMFELEQENEHVFFEAVVELESHNVWVRLHGRSEQTIQPNDCPVKSFVVALCVCSPF